MAVDRCTRCGRTLDLDYAADDIIYVGLLAVCVDCATEEELDADDERIFGPQENT